MSVTPASGAGATTPDPTADATTTPAAADAASTTTRTSSGLAARAARAASPQAQAKMDRALDRAARRDGISGTELARAEAAVAKIYGATNARRSMIAALGLRTDKLSLDAVGWLQGRHGTMDRHVGRYQQVLTTHLKDAKILDANFNGKLDEGDLLYSPGAAGTVDIKRLDAALRDRLKIGGAIIGSANRLARAGHAFVDVTPQGWKNEFSPAFWEGGPFSYTVKQGVKPSDALNDLFKNPPAYKFECGTAMTILYYKAILDLIGPKDFDRVAATMSIGPGYGTGMVPHYAESGGSGTPAAPGVELKAGDRGYIMNWDVSAEGSRLGWSGENVVYLGKGKYYGHPFGIDTGENIVRYLNGYREAGSTRDASLTSMHGVLESGVLGLDQEPG